MPYGLTGTNLEIDLSRGKVEKRQSDPRLAEMYLGGKGTNAKILWDRVPPEVEPFSPGNLLIFGAGVLTGTIVPGANRICITFRSPVTNTQMYSVLGGFFGAELKHAGYDAIVISGKSPAPVYLWINDGQVEIRDASHLWGKDTRETQRLIQEELKNSKVQVACIGQAGENKVYAASIEHSTGASASRAGVGAVMGDKRLKAIAVYGTKDVNVANTSRLIELCDQIMARAAPVRTKALENLSNFLIGPFIHGGTYGYLSADENFPPELQREIAKAAATNKDFIDKFRAREVACYNCGLRCKHVYPRPDGGHSFIKCGSWVTPLIASRVIDWSYAIEFYNRCEKYGLDSKATGNYITFLMNLYQNGILTREDTDGIHLEYGNREIVLSLVDKIALRQGIGTLVANGIHNAASKIGRGAEEYFYHTKKLELGNYEPLFSAVAALRQAVSDKADMVGLGNSLVSMYWPRPREEREAYIKSGFFQYPKEFEKYFLSDYDRTGADYEGLVQFLAYDHEMYAFADSMGLCMFWMGFWGYPPINSRALIADLISSVTGMDMDEARATKIARRTVNLIRAYMVREGIRRKDDSVPEMFFQRTPHPPAQTLDHDRFNKWIDRYYEIKGWNSEGIPTRETLAALDLDYVIEDLRQRGILTDSSADIAGPQKYAVQKKL